MIMKSLIYLSVLVFFSFCGSSNPRDKDISNPEELNIENTADSVEELSEESENNQFQSSDWEIDDYAEYFEDDCIKESSDDIDWNDPEEKCHLFYETKDVQGGFVSIRGGMEGWIEYVMFRMANGKDLICRMAVGCGPACDYDYKFYYCNGEFNSEAGPELFPYSEMQAHQEVMYQKGLKKYGDFDYSEDQQLRYVFPQKGTSMDVNLILGADEIEYPIMTLGWNKTNFYVEEVIEEIREDY